jgi:thiamine transport system substrate-binding protein
MKRSSKNWIGLALGLWALSWSVGVSANTPNPPSELRVAVYRSFVGSYGPGAKIKAAFEAQCACKILWLVSDDAGSLYTDLRSKRHRNVDVVLGFDQSQIDLFRTASLLDGYRSQRNSRGPVPWLDAAKRHGTDFQPVDFGYFAIVVDTAKAKSAPRAFREFLKDPNFVRSLAAQDPRTSTPGLGLLVWLRTMAKDDKDFDTLLEQLGRQALTFSKGWSEAYGLFTKGETRSVFSYVTSSLYHQIEEKTDRYAALAFDEGHPEQVEFAAVVKGSSKDQLAKTFLDFLTETDTQKTIAMGNWMFPVTADGLAALPTAFQDQLKRFKPVPVDASLYQVATRRKLIQSWSKILSKQR